MSDKDAGMVTEIGVPVVDVVGVLRDERVPLVHTDDQAVGRLGAEHLIERGFRHFGFGEYAGWFWSAHRREGFQTALRAKGYDCDLHVMPLPGPGMGGPETWEQRQAALAEWLAALPKPVGIMATNDPMGRQILEACQRLQINVPEEIAVVGADDDEPICRIAWPPLSSVIINDHQRGYEAAALLDRMMRGEPAPKEPIYVQPVGVRARASTDTLAVDDAIVVRALRFLRENACSGIGVDDVVRAVPISRSVLARRFQKIVGRSINNEIMRVKINRAMELLTETSLELKAIAYKTGFGSQAYMNAVFQDKLGKTPGTFRREGHLGRTAGADPATDATPLPM
jgi:LacI family transcriptional regulator